MSEFTWYDSDANGTYDTGVADLDGDGVLDTSAFDLNANGVVDTYLTDSDGDSVIGDVIYSDADENGVTDAMGFDANGDAVVDAVANPATGWQLVPVTSPAPSQDTGFTGTPTAQVTMAGMLQNTDDPIEQAMLANAITLMNVSYADNPWVD